MVDVKNVSGEDLMVADQTPALWPDGESRDVPGEQAKALLEQPYFERADRGRKSEESSK